MRIRCRNTQTQSRQDFLFGICLITYPKVLFYISLIQFPSFLFLIFIYMLHTLYIIYQVVYGIIAINWDS